MQSTLDIRINNTEGAIERILCRLRQRGYSVCSMNVNRSPDNSTFVVQATIESTRPMEQAAKQLTKLFDVQSVKLHAQPMEVMPGNGYAQREKESELRVCASV
jgi:acetolactate synthase regulatory subunit